MSGTSYDAAPPTRVAILHHPAAQELVYWRNNKHKVYTDFPDGEKCDTEAMAIDWWQPVTVIQSEEKFCYRQTKRTQEWIICHYVAIKFGHGRQDYWTTFSRGGYSIMDTKEEFEKKWPRRRTHSYEAMD